MRDVVIVEAVRSPIGKRSGSLAGLHALDLLAHVQRSVIERSGVDPLAVGQVVGGCVSQVGMQTGNIARNAWLAAGLPIEVPATTVDSQCGSSQQAASLAVALVGSGAVNVAMACGIEMMSRVPMGAAIPKDPDVGKPVNRTYWQHHEFTSQFEAAERIADKWAITREQCDALGKSSQDRAAAAQAEGRFDEQIVPVEAPMADGARRSVTRDECPRATTLEGLAGLTPVARPDGVHTAGTSSQISDGAGAVLLMEAGCAEQLGVRPLARVVDTCLVGSDPTLMLTGPIPATQRLLDRNGLTIDDIDVVEINEAFASVILAWQQEVGADLERVNPNGGAIALGHPLGGTGAILLTKAAHELARTSGRYALVTMCCGGGVATGTLLERV